MAVQPLARARELPRAAHVYPVFAEPSGRRWRLVRLGCVVTLVALGLLLARQLAPVVELIHSPLPGPAPETVVAELGAQPVVVGTGPLVRIVHVHAGLLSDPFTGADLGRLAPVDRADAGSAANVVQRYGYGAGTRMLSLTFDDGPDPTWTPRILDLLARHHLHATFFVTGRAAARYPDLVRRIVSEGHALGNH